MGRINVKFYYMLLVVIIFVVVVLLDTSNVDKLKASSISCHIADGNILKELKDSEPKPGEGIFFHDTSCGSDEGWLSLKSRQACAVESAAKSNPDRDVFVLISAPVKHKLKDLKNEYIEQLLTYPNIKFRRINNERYLSRTPAGELYSSGALNNSLYPLSHTSDVLRCATLFKYGGTYLDLDVIVMKPFDKMVNFAGAESSRYINGAIVNFGNDEVGRQMASDSIHELANTFRGDDWGFNGPGLITRVLRRRCRTRLIWKMTYSRCQSFSVLPPSAFYPVSFTNWTYYFSDEYADVVMNSLGSSYAVHVWNRKSEGMELSKKGGSAYCRLQKEFCPKIFSVPGDVL